MQFKSSNSGIGILQVLIVIGLLGMISLGVSRMLKNTSASVRRNAIDDERVGLFSQLRKSISCEKTFEELGQAPGECGPSKDKAIAVFRADRELISSSGSKMGNWMVQAICRNTEGLDVRVAYIGNGTKSEAFPDPVNQVPLDFEHPKNRLSPSPCAESGPTSLPDLDCVTASRKLNSITSSKANVVQAYNRGVVDTETFRWGLVCTERYNRMSCAMNTPTKLASDYDITLIDRGCSSDNDEWAGQFTLQIVCCRLTR